MKKGNLLIIEDEYLLAQNLARLLETRADNVYVANDGTRGMHILQHEPVHCVICDIFMPDVTGIDVIKMTRQNGNSVPFIFFTAYAVTELREEVLKYDRTTFVVKPDIEGLVAVTDQFLKKGYEEHVEKYR